MTNQITVRVPASPSNLGPGFDCLGVGLRLYNSITTRRAKDRQRHENIVQEAADLFFSITKRPRFLFSCSAIEKVPRCRGLGSSATIRLGVLHGLNELAGRPLDRWSIFGLCAELECHPDNAAPARFGGFTVARGDNVQRFTVASKLKFVPLIPALAIRTAAARKILPTKISRLGAVESAGNAGAIAAAFASRNYQKLRGAFADQLHQPFRTKLIPFLPRVIAAAENAGALGAFLSGSGSTICAVTLESSQKIADAMQRAATSASSQVIITTADNSGVQIRDPRSAIRN